MTESPLDPMRVLLVLLLLTISKTFGEDGNEPRKSNHGMPSMKPYCSLNGEFVDSDDPEKQCICDPPWSGDDCSILEFEPIEMTTQGYGMDPNITTWGGGVIHDKDGDGLYHLYVSRMTNNCSLRHYMKNSRIDHAVSKTITGPYIFQDVAVNTFSHNSEPIVLPDGTYAIFHVGDGSGPPDGGDKCTSAMDTSIEATDNQDLYNAGNGILLETSLEGMQSDTQQRRTTTNALPHSTAIGSTIHVSDSLNGPWIPLANNTLGHCNNPSPFIHPTNGTIFLVCNQRQLLRSDSITGPWIDVVYTSGNELFNHSDGPKGSYEDPNLYIDHRGHFHVLWHVYSVSEHPPHGHECVDSTVSGHSFSPDGITWYDSPIQPYTTQILLTSGMTVTAATRERPRLIFDSSTGRMTHLLTATCSVPNCPNGPPAGCVNCKYDSWDFTLIVPLKLT